MELDSISGSDNNLFEITNLQNDQEVKNTTPDMDGALRKIEGVAIKFLTSLMELVMQSLKEVEDVLTESGFPDSRPNVGFVPTSGNPDNPLEMDPDFVMDFFREAGMGQSNLESSSDVSNYQSVGLLG